MRRLSRAIGHIRPGRPVWVRSSFAVAAASVAALAILGLSGIAPAAAQTWWPFGNETNDRPPVPREPVYRQPQGGNAAQPYPPPQQQPYPNSAPAQPYAPAPPPPTAQPYAPAAPAAPGQPAAAPGQAWGAGPASRNPICRDLEQRLVQESQRGNDSRTMLPAVQNELRQVQQQNRDADRELERGNCYEYFLFSKTLRRTRTCVDLSNRVEQTGRRMQELEAQLQQLQTAAGRSYQDDIIRELARNNCGANYQQQARQRDSNPSSFWDDGEGGPGRATGPSYGNLGYATYRTVCVRLCDGYYFPVSFATLPNHFEQDAEACQSKCAAPAALYYHQNPGGGIEQAVAASTNEPYTQLKTAFRYRKEYIQGCSCKMAEYVPEVGGAQPQQGAVQTPGAATASAAPPAPPATGSEVLPWNR